VGKTAGSFEYALAGSLVWAASDEMAASLVVWYVLKQLCGLETIREIGKRGGKLENPTGQSYFESMYDEIQLKSAILKLQ